MAENGLPCLDLLEATPGILRGLMSELTGEDARWKPASERFSVAAVLAHLSHSESHCYRMRLDRFMAETRPQFEPDDAQMYLELYRGADPEEAFNQFEDQRKTNLEFLRALPTGAGERVAVRRDYARPDVERVGASRSRPHATGRGAGARPKIPGGCRSDGRVI